MPAELRNVGGRGARAVLGAAGVSGASPHSGHRFSHFLRVAALAGRTWIGGLEDLGLALQREAWPAVGRVKVRAVPKEGWRRFFEYVSLERETGGSRTGATYSAVEVRYRLDANVDGARRARRVKP